MKLIFSLAYLSTQSVSSLDALPSSDKGFALRLATDTTAHTDHVVNWQRIEAHGHGRILKQAGGPLSYLEKTLDPSVAEETRSPAG